MENSSSTSGQNNSDAMRSIPQTNLRKQRNTSLLKHSRDRKALQKHLLDNIQMAINNYNQDFGVHIGAVVCTGGGNSPLMFLGTNPLTDILRSIGPEISRSLGDSTPEKDTDELFELPPLLANGVPTPLQSMKRTHLKTFILLMLKYVTDHGKPEWGKEDCKPVWWPTDVPWANIRFDSRSDAQKAQESWTVVLRKIISNCYTYYGRQDLLDRDSGILENDQENASRESLSNDFAKLETKLE